MQTRSVIQKHSKSKRLNKSPSAAALWLTLLEPSEYPATAFMLGSAVW